MPIKPTSHIDRLQQVCLEVRQRNCEIDGRPVLFYAKRIGVQLVSDLWR
jgi:hypothetical protein